MKIDIHTHGNFIETDNNKAKVSLGTFLSIAKVLQSQGINKAIVMSLGEKGACSNLVLEKLCRENHFFSWFGNIDYHPYLSQKSIDKKIYALIEKGALGLGELMHNLEFNNTFLEKIFRGCNTFEYPVLFHLSPRKNFSYGLVDEAGIPNLEKALEKYPKLPFIAHSQPFWIEISKDAPKSYRKRNMRGYGQVRRKGRVELLLDRYENLYCDLSAGSGGCAIIRDEDFGIEFINRYHQRLLFGTDTFNSGQYFPLNSWIESKYKEGKISEEAYNNIFYKNAERLLFR